MIGAVNYGSGRKAYRPEQTVAGKTGTCIGQGAWLGLFTSYAPVVNPRLAVVVITRGSDARGHLPAAVAGSIYRTLSTRFGTVINFQVAQGADDEEQANPRDKKAAALNEEAAETKAATEAEENAAEEAETANSTANPSTNAVNPSTNNATGSDIKSKVKTTSMPIENKSKSPAKTVTPAKPKASDNIDGRSRRTQPEKQ
jgi:membrane peptidoglycan carboxypeptidase